MLKKLANGFEYITVSNAKASAKIALQGAHIFEFCVKNREALLWLSPVSHFEYGKAIRGGIPICWPRFGVLDKSMPTHGFSRTAAFELVNIEEINRDVTEVTLRLRDTQISRAIWNYRFELDVVFRVAQELSVKMITKNCDTKEFVITEALHTYFDVSSIEDIKISGLEDVEYLDTLTNTKAVQEGVLKINAECDRVYMGDTKRIVLEDKNKTITLNTVGSHSAVVWNPWIEKGSKMSGMKTDAYKQFICIETANAFDDFRVLKPNESHILEVTFSL